MVISYPPSICGLWLCPFLGCGKYFERCRGGMPLWSGSEVSQAWPAWCWSYQRCASIWEARALLATLALRVRSPETERCCSKPDRGGVLFRTYPRAFEPSAYTAGCNKPTSQRRGRKDFEFMRLKSDAPVELGCRCFKPRKEWDEALLDADSIHIGCFNPILN